VLVLNAIMAFDGIAIGIIRVCFLAGFNITPAASREPFGLNSNCLAQQAHRSGWFGKSGHKFSPDHCLH
jgi:hypothetical protein